ncbi:hypothetical protein EON83_11785 [bacterium]|nr:MAG: hypothetical protein EON83_11785 [bacterium]
MELAIGSSLPVQITQKGVIIGGFLSFALCAFITLCVIIHFDAVLYGLIPLVFVGVVFSGAYGSAERQRNGHGDNDSQLGQLGVGLLSACFPLIGLLLTLVFGRGGSDKASAALWGTVTGVGLFILTFLTGLVMSK